MSKRKQRQRNPLHNHPLMHKGGIHQKTRKAQRRGDKQALRRQWPFSRADHGLLWKKATPLHIG